MSCGSTPQGPGARAAAVDSSHCLGVVPVMRYRPCDHDSRVIILMCGATTTLSGTGTPLCGWCKSAWHLGSDTHGMTDDPGPGARPGAGGGWTASRTTVQTEGRSGPGRYSG